MNFRSNRFSGTQKHGQAQNCPFPERIIPQGTMEFTGNALDPAIAGENAFSASNTPKGDFLSRSGHFNAFKRRNDDDADGHPVSGTGGNIVIPAGTRNVVIGRRRPGFAEPGVGDPTRLSWSASIIPGSGKSWQRILQTKGKRRCGRRRRPRRRRREGGNRALSKGQWRVVLEMVSMIEVNRQFETYQKVMQTPTPSGPPCMIKFGKRVG